MKDENNNYGVMAEWSKAIDLRSIIFGCAGSNPAGTILKHNFVSNPIRLLSSVGRASDF